jgi:SAM-dependent methyltransferase
MDKKDKKVTIERYNNRISKMGYTEKALGWTRDNNHVRFKALTNLWKDDLSGSSIFDFGCGMGDFCTYLKNEINSPFTFNGLDINAKLIAEAKNRFPEFNFVVGDIFDYNVENEYEFTFSSGVFNHKLNFSDEYDIIYKCLKQMFYMSSKGVAVNFLSDKVDYLTDYNFNASPSKILEFSYSLTNNVVLLNNYMPFEFTVLLRKDKIINKELLIFSN